MVIIWFFIWCLAHMSILQEMRRSCEQRDIPIISQATERFLHKFLEEQKPNICLEFGGAVGYSGISLAQKIQARNGLYYSFEISYPSYRESLGRANKSQTYNLISYPYNCLQVPMEKFLPKKKVDFVFIDAQKAQYWAYLAKIENIIHDKTVIVIDDVIKYHHKLSSLYRYLSKKQIKYEILPLDHDDGVMTINMPHHK